MKNPVVKKNSNNYDKNKWAINYNGIEISGYVFVCNSADSTLLAFCSVNIGNMIVINDIALRERKDKSQWFLSFPSRMDKNGNYKDIAFIMDKELLRAIEDAIAEKYMHLRVE